jgi:hypothetical protein
MQVIVIHERSDEKQRITAALKTWHVNNLVLWSGGNHFDQSRCTADTLVVLHASNECQNGSLAEQLVEQYAAQSASNATSAYGALGSKLDQVRAMGVVVVSNEYSVSEQLVGQSWARVWPCSLDQFVETIGLLVESLGRGDVPPWDAFVTGLTPWEPALQLLSALLPIGLLWEAHGKSSALKALKQADKDGESSPMEFERRIQRFACSLLGSDCTAASEVWAEIVREHLPALEKFGGADDLKSKLNDLCGADGPEKWNCTLKTLRNKLLAKGDE